MMFASFESSTSANAKLDGAATGRSPGRASSKYVSSLNRSPNPNSVAQRLALLQHVLDALHGLPLAAEADEGLALEVEQVLL